MKQGHSCTRDRGKRKYSEDPATRAWFMIFVLMVCVGMMIYIDFNRRFWKALPQNPIAGRHWGNPDAQLKITQFLDFQSLEVVRGEQLIYQFFQKHPTSVFLQTRYFPQDEKSLLITTAVECANQHHQFRNYTARLFDRYFQWSGLPGVKSVLKTIAGETGIDQDEFKRCMASPDTLATIMVDKVYGESLFVRLAPSYFLNEQMVVGVDDLEKALQDWDEPLTQDE